MGMSFIKGVLCIVLAPVLGLISAFNQASLSSDIMTRSGKMPNVYKELIVLKAEVKVIKYQKKQCEYFSTVNETYLEFLKWETKRKDTVINKLQKAYVEVVFPIKKLEIKRETKDIKKLKYKEIKEVRFPLIFMQIEHHRGKIGVK